jgi:hypothetical protein
VAVDLITALTKSVGASGGSDNIPTPQDRASRVLIRANSAGLFLGGPAVSSTDGYELNAGQEYVFDIYPASGLTGVGSSAYQLHVKNTSGSSVTYSYVVTLLG